MKKNLKFSRNRVIALFLVSILASLTVGTYIGQSRFSGSLEDLPWYPGAPSPYSYIIDVGTDGATTTYYAFNGTTGYPDYSGTNPSQTIINAIHADSSILIRAGLYTIDSTIRKDVDNVVISGEGNGTIIKVADSTDINAFELDGVQGWVIQNLQIDGNRDNQALGGDDWNQNAIMVFDSQSCVFQSLYIHHMVQSGIVLRNYTTSDIKMLHNFIEQNTGHAFRVTEANRVLIDGNHIRNCSIHGYPYSAIMFYGESGVITNNLIEYGNGDGIEAYPPKNVTISNNVIRYKGRCGIYINVGVTWGLRQVIIDSNVVYGCGLNLSETWGQGIRVVSPYTIVSNNHVWANRQQGIYVATVGDNSTVCGNLVCDNLLGGITLYLSDGCSISDNICINNTWTYSGIEISQSNYTSVCNNVIQDGAGLTTDKAYYGTYIGNTIFGCHYGFKEHTLGTSYYNVLIGTNCYGTTYGLRMGGAEASSTSRVYACYNNTVWVESWGSG